MTENDCMTIKQLIAQWNGLTLTKEGHVKFTLEIPLDANLNEICRRRVPDKFMKPGLHFRWFKDGNRPTAALIRELVGNKQLDLFQYGRRIISSGKWVYEVKPAPCNAIKSKGASSLLVSRKAVAEIEKNFYDPAMLLRLDIEAERDWQRYAWQVAEQNKAILERIKQRNNPKVLPTECKTERTSHFQNEKIAPPHEGRKTLEACEQSYKRLKNTSVENIVKRLREQGYLDCTICKTLWAHIGKDKDIFLKKWELGSLFLNAKRTGSAYRKHVDKLLNAAEPHTEEN